MLKPLTLSGYIKNGVLVLDTIPFELQGMLTGGSYTHQAFFNLPEVRIQCTVMYNKTAHSSSLTLKEESIIVFETSLDHEVLEGWTNIAGVWYSPLELEIFETATAIAQNGAVACNILALGKSGYGKTARAGAWALHKQMNYAYVDMSLHDSAETIFGRPGFSNGETIFWHSIFTETLQAGNSVVILDEITRAAHPQALNGLFPILDDRRQTVINTNHGNVEISVGKGTVFVATANEGYEYTGTEVLDSALRKRFGLFFEVSAPPPVVECRILTDRFAISQDTAENIILVLDEIRNNSQLKDIDADVTTRKAVHVAEAYKAGVSLERAFEISMVIPAAKIYREPLITAVRKVL